MDCPECPEELKRSTTNPHRSAFVSTKFFIEMILGYILIIISLVTFSAVDESDVHVSVPPAISASDHKVPYYNCLPDSTINIRQLGADILNGRRVSQVNEEYIYQLIDSIMAVDLDERSFYFSVFNKIYEQATGYIYLEIGFSIKEFLFNYPDEFFNLPDTRIREFAFEIGELFRTEEEFPLESARKYLAELEKKCSPENFSKLQRFGTEMLNAVEGKK